MNGERWLISGRVQGVAYRAYTRAQAVELGVAGWVRNLRDGRVEAEVAAPAEILDELELRLRRGPPASRVDRLERAGRRAAEPLPASFEVRSTG